MDYDGLNKALDAIAEVLNTIRSERSLEQDRIERWSWEQPQITLIWRGHDTVWRNIHTVMLQMHGGVQSPCRIEVNAWQDMKEDMGWMRHWKHSPIMEEGQFHSSLLWRAYETVARWTEPELIKRHRLSEAAGELLETQRM